MTWSASLPDDLKHSECERTDVSRNGGAPPVRTVPDKSNEDSDPQMTSIYTSTNVKEQFSKFSGGSQEQALIHVATFYEIIGKLGLKEEYEGYETLRKDLISDYAKLTRQQKSEREGKENKEAIENSFETMTEFVDKAFMVFQDLLDTKLVPEWLLCVKTCCKTVGYVDWDGVEVPNKKRGMSFDSLRATIRHWMIDTGSFPEDSAERVERYLSTQIKMPTRKELNFKAYIKRIQEICSYLPWLPCMKDMKGSPAELTRMNKKPTELKLCQYILEAIPAKWSNMYWSRKGHHFPMNVDELVSDLALIEPEFRAAQSAINKTRQNEKGGQAKPDSAGRASGKMKDTDRIPKKSKKDRNRDGSKGNNGAGREYRLCQKCAKFSPQSKDTHNTSQCNKWNEDGSRKPFPADKRTKNSNMVSEDLMKCFATMQKQNSELIKQLKTSSRKKKRKRSRYHDESSDSDSEQEVGNYNRTSNKFNKAANYEETNNHSTATYTSTFNNTEYSTPIKVIEKTSNKLQQKVVVGKGIISSIVALPEFRNTTSKTHYRPYRVLLDSGSDGDILFVRKGTADRVPTKSRLSPQKWRTSCGTFETSKVGKNLEFSFPEFSDSRTIKISPDILELPKSDREPAYDLIIGCQTLVNIGCVLNYQDMTVTIDQQKLPMRTAESLSNYKKLQAQFTAPKEPIVTREETKRAVKILDAKYEKADLPKIVKDNCDHLSSAQQRKLLLLLQKYEILFDGTLGDWQTSPVSFQLKDGAKPYHGRPFPVPHVHLKTLKKEVARLCELGVLKRQPSSEWASPTFIIPKKEGTVRFISDFREVNKRIVRTPYPIPKISTILQEMEGFTYATSLDLNMGYYTIRLDGDAQKICTIILPWGKYSYQRLPMGVCGSPDIFQERMTGLMATLDWVRVYIDDLLSLTKGDFNDHLDKLEIILGRLKKANLRVNCAKSMFAGDTVEYLGYVLTREGIRPQPEKVSAILAIQPPTSVKALRGFLGMIQHYRDLWEKRSHWLAPLTDLVGECGHTKTTRKNKTKKKAWYWDSSHQVAFDGIKNALAREVLLAYPDYSEVFEIFTDASSRQLGAVITQKGRPLAFFSRKLSETQRKYSVTELELLSIVECLKEFKGMLWGQRIKVYTDHKNLVQEASGLTSDRVYRWRVLLEEYNPEFHYIKGIDNTVADALSRLEYDPTKNVKDMRHTERYHAISTLFTHYMQKHGGDEMSTSCCDQYSSAHATVAEQVSSVFPKTSVSQDDSLNEIFAQLSVDEDEIYPPTVREIADEQRRSPKYKAYFNPKKLPKRRDKNISLVLVNDTEILVHKKTKYIVPGKELQSRIIQWYHHYLQHPGHTRLEATISLALYWPSMRTQIRQHVKRCDRCQLGKKRGRQHGLLPPKIAQIVPWNSVNVDLVGPYTLKDKSGKAILDFMCLTMIDPATGWFEIVELPTKEVTFVRKGEEIVEILLDKNSATISKLFNKQWLSRYPRPNSITYDNGSEFKLHFRSLCDTYGIKRKATSVKNPQSNAILERIHGVLGNMLRTSGLDMSDDLSPETVDDFLVNAAWAVRSTYHTVLQATPGAAIFGRDMLFDIPFLADWCEIGKRRQQLVDRDTISKNNKRVDFDYKVGDKVTLKKDGILRKAEDKNTGPYVITQVHCNGTIRIQRKSVSERLNIRRVDPWFEQMNFEFYQCLYVVYR